MAKRSGQAQTESNKRGTLQMPRAEAEEKIQSRIEIGKQLLETTIDSKESLDKAEANYRKWSNYNSELLRRIVDTNELEDSYNPGLSVGFFGPTSLNVQINDYRHDVQDKIERLESILERLELLPELTMLTPNTTFSPAKDVTTNNRIFVVHGHDEEAKQSVARCIEKLGLEAIILHEQPNQGRTIIEKFENHAEVGFAIVLLTPDDVGAPKENTTNLTSRARQNVIFELGFFIGKLGRNRVCALHKGTVELPSDFFGVAWVPLDINGAWRFALGKELHSVGFNVDLNLLA